MDFIKLIFFFVIISGEILFLIRYINFPSHLAPLTVMLINTLILYLFALAGALRIGLYFTILVAIIFGVISLLKNKTNTDQKWLSLPIVAFLFILFFVFSYTRGTLFYEWDDFSHWGVIYRYLMIVEKLPKDLSTVFITYPPFTALWQYFVSQIIGFKEENAYFAHILIQFSAIIALIPSKNWKDWKKYCLVLSAAIISVFVIGYRFQSIYVDLILGLFLAAGFAQSKIDGSYTFANFFTALLISISLVLIKPLGLLFGLMVALVNIVAYINSKNQNISHPIKFANLFKILLNYKVILLIIFPLIAWWSWGQYTKNFDLYKINIQIEGAPISSGEIFPWFPDDYINELVRNDSDLVLKTLILMESNDKTIGLIDILRSFTINAPYRTKIISNNFINTFSNIPISKTMITEKLVLFAIILLVGINQFLLKNHQPRIRNMNLIVNGILFFGFVVYGVSLYLAYIFIFLPADALDVPSLQRYLNSYILPWWLMNLVIIYHISIDKTAQKEQFYSKWILGGIVAACFLLIPITRYIHLPYSPESPRFEMASIYKRISQVNFQAQDKIYEVYSGFPPKDQGLRHFIMRYYLTPIPSNIFGWSLGENYLKIGETVDLTPKEWLDLLNKQGYTYVLVSKSNSKFWARFEELFDQYSFDYSQPQLFKITKNKLEFVPLD